MLDLLLARPAIDAIEMVVVLAKVLSAASTSWDAARSTAQSLHLDLKNAFNSADWNATLAALYVGDVPNYLLELTIDYFKARGLLYDTEEGRKPNAVAAGFPKYCEIPCTMVY